jgi:hypothetical protein
MGREQVIGGLCNGSAPVKGFPGIQAVSSWTKTSKRYPFGPGTQGSLLQRHLKETLVRSKQ